VLNDGQKMRCFVGIALGNELHVAGELFQEIMDRLFIISGMHHALAKDAEMMDEVLGSCVHGLRDGGRVEAKPRARQHPARSEFRVHAERIR